MTPFRALATALADAAATAEGYVFIDGRGERRVTYAHLYGAASGLAAALRATGLACGDLVAIVVGDPERFLTSLFATSMAGLVPASLYPPSTTVDLAHSLDATAAVLRSSRARGVVTTPSLVAAMESLRATCPDLSAVIPCDARGQDRVAPAAPSSDAIAFVQFTSGSTSEPKGVVVTEGSLSANIEAINGPAGLDTSPSDSAVSWLPLHHDMGLVGMALGALYARRPAVLMTPAAFVKRPAEWLRAISRHGGTVSFAPSFAYDLCVRRVKDREIDDLDLSRWRIAGCGGEPVHGPALAAFAEKFRPAGFREKSFLPSYGLAEHTLAATFPPHGRGIRTARISEHGDIVSCGFPLPGHQLQIVDDRGSEVGERTVGEIVLAGPSVMRGYYADDRLTAEAVRDGWLHTGDLGFVDAGELFVCGRTKDLLVVHGHKYHPQDLEWAVEGLPGIRRGRVVAFGVARPGAADRAVMVVEPSGTVPAGALVRAVRQRVSEVCGLFVDDVVAVPNGTIGRTTSGKVQRFATKLRYERGELC